MKTVELNPDQAAIIESLLIDEAEEVRSFANLLQDVQDFIIAKLAENEHTGHREMCMLHDITSMKKTMLTLAEC